MASYRCTVCHIEWPVAVKFRKCPECGDKTWRHDSGEPMTTKEANERLDRIEAHAKFEDFYERWDAERETNPEAEIKVNPDELGREQGREFARDLKAIKSLEEADADA